VARQRRQSSRPPVHKQPARTRRIVLVVAPGAEILDLVGPFQVFTTAATLYSERYPRSAPIYRVEIVACSRQTSFTTNCGLQMHAHRSFRQVRGEIDTLLVAGGSAVEGDRTSPETVRWLRGAAAQTRRLGSVCTGALLLARAGLLNGRKATTHWNWCRRLARRYPQIEVEPDPIFIRDGSVYTSAGVTAGMDLALALVEEDHGSRLALQVARQLVLYLRRPGGQSQFSAALSQQLSDRQPLRELQSWVLENLDKSLSVQMLAERVAMSPRNFARIFSKEMRITPGRFVERLRIETARRRLEETPHSLKKIAAQCGFGSVGAMRSVFQRLVGIPPGQYRQHFRGTRGALDRAS
jgi:transcriptional regulator GlxA family with amidase domain